MSHPDNEAITLASMFMKPRFLDRHWRYTMPASPFTDHPFFENYSDLAEEKWHSVEIGDITLSYRVLDARFGDRWFCAQRHFGNNSRGKISQYKFMFESDDDAAFFRLML